VVAGHVEREPDARGEAGLRAAGDACEQPLRVKAERGLQRVQAVERGGLVGIARHHQRARAVEPRIAIARGLELGAEGVEAAGPLEP
jgi:hypothetical protein